MKHENICKFITPREQGSLLAENFVYEQACPRDGEMQTLACHAVYLVSGGEGIFRCAGGCGRLEKGVLFFSFAGVPFCIENTGKVKYYYISFHGGRADELLRRFGVTPERSIFPGHEGLLPLWQESLTRADGENLDLVCESQLLYAFSRLKKPEREKENPVDLVLRYLEEHFTDPTLTLEETAKAAGYNPKYLSHLFRRTMGVGFAEYLRLLRIRQAVMLLENGVTSVKNVAALCGFADPLYFSRVFTGEIGVPPTQYGKRET